VSPSKDVTPRRSVLLDDRSTQEALPVLESDFSNIESLGPRRVAEFVHGRRDDDLHADVRGLVLDLVARCRTTG
jgi:hypothetical protein